MNKDYLQEIDIAISVCDRDGKIVYINEKGAKTFYANGGMDLIGSDILDCHPEPSKTRMKELMITHETQSYIKGEGDKQRMIHQTPIYKDGEFDGYMEMIIPLSSGFVKR